MITPRSVVAIFLLFVQTSFARHTLPPDSSQNLIRITPGAEYDAGFLHTLFWGAHWRDMWNTEFSAELLDLDTFASGLSPTKKGGSLQTLNLRFMGNDGREYKFRSLNKDGKRTLPPELQMSVVGDIYQDQISIGNPMAAVVVPVLLDAVGVLNASPRIVVMPQGDRLGEFNKEFAGVLGTIEEHPKAGKQNDPGFHFAERIIDGFEIFDMLAADPDNRIDETEFLKARLMDVLLGDRDRHADQWRWAAYTVNGKRLWRPIPRDRDFAFGRYDGLFPWAAGLFAHSAVGFGEHYPSIRELTWIGRQLDRRFLSELDKPVWDSVATFIRTQLTDSVLQRALGNMPAEMYRTAGEQMFRMLKSRRNKLGTAADEFYKLVSDVVDIYGSDKAERAEVNRVDDKHVHVSVYEKQSGELLFNRTLSSASTSELRIYLLGDDDVATVNGGGTSGIRIRIIGGEGADELIDNARFGPTGFYDDGRTKVVVGASTCVELAEPDSTFDERIPEPKTEDRYEVWRVLPLLNFTSDDGLIAGGYADRTQYGFRLRPHAEFMQMTARFAPKFKHYDVHVMAESYRMVANARAEFLLDAGNLGLTGFYGLGNETTRDKTLAATDYYRANYHTIRIEPTLNIPLSMSSTMRFGVRYEYSNATVAANTLLDQAQPYGLGVHSNLAVDVRWTYDKRDFALAPTRGLFVSAGGALYPALFRNDAAFGRTRVDAHVYLPIATRSVFALHAGAEKVFGTHPFTHAALLGGASTLRGFSHDRFAGDASAYAQAEMRIPLVPVNFFAPSILGLAVFGDAGRVFLAGETSTKWHSAYGGGVWLNVVSMFVLNFSVARSPEETRFYVTSGFGF